MTRRIILIGLALLIVVLVAVTFYKSAAIAYHRSAMMFAYTKIFEVGPNGDQGPWIESHEYHRDRLIDHGYLARREFVLVVTPPENYRVWKQVTKELPYNILTCMTSDPKPMIIVIDRPDRIPAWQAAIRKYDVPSGLPGQTTRPLTATGVSPSTQSSAD